LRPFLFNLLFRETQQNPDFAGVMYDASFHFVAHLLEHLPQICDSVNVSPIRARLARQQSAALPHKFTEALYRRRKLVVGRFHQYRRLSPAPRRECTQLSELSSASFIGQR
jgi:hypothetical protein